MTSIVYQKIIIVVTSIIMIIDNFVKPLALIYMYMTLLLAIFVAVFIFFQNPLNISVFFSPYRYRLPTKSIRKHYTFVLILYLFLFYKPTTYHLFIFTLIFTSFRNIMLVVLNLNRIRYALLYS